MMSKGPCQSSLGRVERGKGSLGVSEPLWPLTRRGKKRTQSITFHWRGYRRDRCQRCWRLQEPKMAETCVARVNERTQWGRWAKGHFFNVRQAKQPKLQIGMADYSLGGEVNPAVPFLSLSLSGQRSFASTWPCLSGLHCENALVNIEFELLLLEYVCLMLQIVALAF